MSEVPSRNSSGKKPKSKFKKAPQAPKRFKSSYMFFSTHKHKEIRKQTNNDSQSTAMKTTAVAKMVSEAWKNLSAEEREKWEELARRDKARYIVEKESYTGPWKVPVKRKMKDPDAPRRPMSAFLAYSHAKRQEVKQLHPEAMSTEISRILATNWKNASEEERKPFVDEEYELRLEYKAATTAWKANKKAEEERHSREQQEEHDASTDHVMYQKNAYKYQTWDTSGSHGNQGNESSFTPSQQGHIGSYHHHGGWSSSQTEDAPPTANWYSGTTRDQNPSQHVYQNTNQSPPQAMNGYNATNTHHQYTAEGGMHPSYYHDHASNHVDISRQTAPHSNPNAYSHYHYSHQPQYHTHSGGATMEGGSWHPMQGGNAYYSNNSMATDHSYQEHPHSGSNQLHDSREQGFGADHSLPENQADENNFAPFNEDCGLQRSDYTSDDLHQNQQEAPYDGRN